MPLPDDFPSPFPPALEGFQVLLLAGAASSESAIGILTALDDDDTPLDPADYPAIYPPFDDPDEDDE